MTPRTVTVNSLSAFEHEVRDLKPHRPIPFRKKLFRGQTNDWPLLPSLFRLYSRKVDQIRAKEAEILDRLKARIPRHTPLRPDNDWDWLSFGQHYGLKTRMLDWSEDPLIALFFALENLPPKPTVYVYPAPMNRLISSSDDKKSESPFAQNHTRIVSPSVHSVRVRLQKGCHTSHALHEAKKGNPKIVIPLLHMTWYQEHMCVISVPPSAVAAIRKELADKGVYHSSVYGDFDKICSKINNDCGL